jgi:hypothetical protein
MIFFGIDFEIIPKPFLQKSIKPYSMLKNGLLEYFMDFQAKENLKKIIFIFYFS